MLASIHVKRIKNREVSITFHVPFSLIDDERIATTTSLLVLHNSDPFNCAVHFKFSAKVVLRCVFVLWVLNQLGVLWLPNWTETYQSGNEKSFVRVADCLRVFLWFI